MKEVKYIIPKRKNRFVNKHRARDIIIRILVVLAILYVLGWVMNNDYNDAVRDEKAYCKMVKDGRWPPYKGDDFCK